MTIVKFKYENTDGRTVECVIECTEDTLAAVLTVVLKLEPFEMVVR